MLLWQPRKPHDQIPLVKQCLLISAGVHLVLMLSLFFVYQDYNQRLHLTLSKHATLPAAVKIVPFAHQSTLAKMHQQEAMAVRKTAAPQQSVVVQEAKKEEPVQKVAEKVELQPVNSGHVVVVPSTPKVAKKEKPSKKQAKKSSQKSKKAAKKQLEKNKSKKSEKPQVEPKVQEVVKQEEKKPEPAKVEPEKNVAQEAPKQEIPQVGTPVVAAAVSSGSQAATSATEQATSAAPQEFVYVTQQEFDALQVQQKLQSCLFDQWTPPLGVPATAQCEVLITIGWDGAVLETDYLKKTAIVLYDLSVQEALEQVTFPHELWGKRVTITFKP